MDTSSRFTAKVKRNGKIVHHWEPVGVGLYATICNPGLQRGKSELFEPNGREELCKVCKIHLRVNPQQGRGR